MGSGANGDPAGGVRYSCPCCKLGDPDVQAMATEWLHQEFLRIPDLTGRELQLFGEMAWGPSNEELSEILGITIRTAKFHLENIRGKLGGISRVQVCLLAVQHRIARCSVGHI
ncbi:helix-turn-helix domain-containing protein [Streptomyces sp. NPDC048269]|uniref:response regulator transcription factor n=1 Tax=Streptomyces sp. NPDC048269 TaxID=3155753 RepID=UPI0034415BE2